MRKVGSGSGGTRNSINNDKVLFERERVGSNKEEVIDGVYEEQYTVIKESVCLET